MAGDKKGKGKVIPQAKKKRIREERDWDRAIAAADAANQPQHSIRICDSEVERQGEPEDTPQLHRSARTRTIETAQPTLPPRVGPRTRGCAVQRRGTRTQP